jgi:hypothetical protein
LAEVGNLAFVNSVFREVRLPMPEACMMRMLRRMLAVSIACAAVLAWSPALSAQAPKTDPDRPSDFLERDFAPGGHVHLDLSAGQYEIVGTSDRRLRIEWSVRRPRDLQRVRTRANISGSDAWVIARGPDNSGFRVVVKVPSRSDLTVDLSAGEIRVASIQGNKRIESWAGEVHVDVGRAEDYRHVHASVLAGEIKASAFKTSKDGLFRSFDWSGRGPYVLSASLWAGELWLYEGELIEAK